MASPSNILLDFSTIPSIVQQFRKKGKKIILTQGSFDLVHIGHGRYLEKAKSYGDVLVVGIDSDEKIKKRKGSDRPVVPEEERAEMLTYFRSVDFVVIKPLIEKKFELVRLVKPDVLVLTEETYAKYSPEQLAELKTLCKKIEVMKAQATTSTSAKIRLVQIGAASKIGAALSKKLIHSIEEVLKELKEEVGK